MNNRCSNIIGIHQITLDKFLKKEKEYFTLIPFIMDTPELLKLIFIGQIFRNYFETPLETECLEMF